ncbi:unnamed protein product [Sphagnum troendelagicum]|uniref:Uncharacterized protein n=1 Tax=Sphagnum troendelagicum TaxID=128251 RepID=A0ABP0TEK1_9BRYO
MFHSAAVKIQSCYKGYLCRRAIWLDKGWRCVGLANTAANKQFLCRPFKKQKKLANTCITCCKAMTDPIAESHNKRIQVVVASEKDSKADLAPAIQSTAGFYNPGTHGFVSYGYNQEKSPEQTTLIKSVKADLAPSIQSTRGFYVPGDTSGVVTLGYNSEDAGFEKKIKQEALDRIRERMEEDETKIRNQMLKLEEDELLVRERMQKLEADETKVRDRMYQVEEERKRLYDQMQREEEEMMKEAERRRVAFKEAAQKEEEDRRTLEQMQREESERIKAEAEKERLMEHARVLQEERKKFLEQLQAQGEENARMQREEDEKRRTELQQMLSEEEEKRRLQKDADEKRRYQLQQMQREEEEKRTLQKEEEEKSRCQLQQLQREEEERKRLQREENERCRMSECMQRVEEQTKKYFDQILREEEERAREVETQKTLAQERAQKQEEETRQAEEQRHMSEEEECVRMQLAFEKEVREALEMKLLECMLRKAWCQFLGVEETKLPTCVISTRNRNNVLQSASSCCCSSQPDEDEENMIGAVCNLCCSQGRTRCLKTFQRARLPCSTPTNLSPHDYSAICSSSKSPPPLYHICSSICVSVQRRLPSTQLVLTLVLEMNKLLFNLEQFAHDFHQQLTSAQKEHKQMIVRNQMIAEIVGEILFLQFNISTCDNSHEQSSSTNCRTSENSPQRSMSTKDRTRKAASSKLAIRDHCHNNPESACVKLHKRWNKGIK